MPAGDHRRRRQPAADPRPLPCDRAADPCHAGKTTVSPTQEPHCGHPDTAQRASGGEHKTIPAAQRASFRIVKELGLLGPREKMTEDVAKALLRRFEEPLSDSDIAVITKLTHLDSDALRVMARMAGPDGHAAEAGV
ncbi:Cytochrome P450 71D8 [Hordeum vulgare]|nr:Cytochrome P450 71D8 [Hordeum vulgare]